MNALSLLLLAAIPILMMIGGHLVGRWCAAPPKRAVSPALTIHELHDRRVKKLAA